ncbi:peptide ABC transporter ATPase [Pseudonocardia sp. EC080610-09]|uniref:ABC transporter ATP-binding protein n=1 Tax=unclassified Pseudonocardia TaxID=2619320 RepID=UPI0006CB6C85|nr:MULTISPECIES: oligopeptide/dipeptide ABC transporter ATP-binding protein [unclassified Pseudonocardia]ALE73438.1 peptide ABC transporter ATPase [Pseudonocardia sp. EC080625-04]ALL77044.1 peptide ABC transporter ATPase [Pseudonocardia sp. EC080610-09]ALL84075.1 peptide ABC transporter ATPase [Pseudonocardia sp. EC080619-01]
MTGGGAAGLLEVDDLRVTFGSRGLRGRGRTLRAVDGVSLRLARGQTLGLVGESGSGKSTLGRAVLRLVPVAGGRVRLDGTDLTALRGRALRDARRTMQMVFQDPYSSLDPSAVIGDSIAEPLREHEGLSRRDAASRVRALLDVVGLPASHADRYPYEFSGGQRQRVAIARAVALHPSLVVCDEAVSALDVSTQNQVINLLEDLREQFGLSYLFIAHDLAVVRHIAHTVAVMYLGHVVETGPTDRVYDAPAHPYTRALLSAIPATHPGRAGTGTRMLLSGDLPDPADPPAGCPFVTRCPFAMDVCRETPPAMTPVDGGGEVACHLETGVPAGAVAP